MIRFIRGALPALLLVLVLLAAGCARQALPAGTATHGQTLPTVPTEPLPVPTVPSVTEPPALPVPAPDVALNARVAFVFDLRDGRLLCCTGEPTAPLYPASLTKLLTALTALRLLSPDTVLTAGEELSLLQPGASIAYIKPGHRLTVRMLIEGMLLPSGNDAAYVLAAGAGRAAAGAPELPAAEAVAAFVSEMNREAAALGLVNSHFESPDGYHSDGHYTCPADLTVIAAAALRDETIAPYLSLTEDHVVYASGQTNTWHNTNQLLVPDSPYYTPDAVGMKTGHTEEAGYCLLTATGGETPLLVGVFGCTTTEDRFEDTVRLLNRHRGAV